jgi:CubicO group peptidase (beta-lactamase class C family)
LSSPSQQLRQLLEEALTERVFSGYQLHFEKRGRVHQLSGGVTSYWPKSRPITESSFFDIGSVTKAVVTTSLYARLVDKGEIKFDEKISRSLKCFEGTPLADRTVEDLLGHSSGLIGWYEIYRETDRKGFLDWFEKSLPKLLINDRRKAVVYSDLGFLLLGCILESRFGELNSLFQEEVVKPLGISETQYGPLVDSLGVAATEYCLWRKRILQGEVFDENCFALGGVCSHAGLFATARGLVPWCREWLKAVKGKSSWLGKQVATQMSRPTAWVKGSSWGLGWDTKSAAGSSAGKHFSASSFGHLGYPGCSVWIDPEAEGFAIFLTNRIHPSRCDERIRRVRPEIHDAIALCWQHD